MNLSQKNLITSQLKILLIFLSFNTLAQKTPEQIYEKYYAALGGKERLLGIETLTITSKGLSNVEKGGSIVEDTVTSIMFLKKPDKLRIETSIPTNLKYSLIIYNNLKGFFYDSLGNKTSQDIMNTDSILNNYTKYFKYRIIEEFYYKELGVKSALAGIEQIDEKKVFKIICSFKNIQWYNYYEVKSGLKIRHTLVMEYGYLFPNNISNYKIINGIKFPFPNYEDAKETHLFTKLFNYSIKINEPIDDEKFNID